jgi:hypothetical protein
MKHKCPSTRQIPEVAIIVKTQGHDFKIYGFNINVLSQVTSIRKNKSPITYHSKDMAKVKVFIKWVKLQGQGHKVKIMVPLESSCHKEYTYEI